MFNYILNYDFAALSTKLSNAVRSFVARFRLYAAYLRTARFNSRLTQRQSRGRNNTSGRDRRDKGRGQSAEITYQARTFALTRANSVLCLSRKEIRLCSGVPSRVVFQYVFVQITAFEIPAICCSKISQASTMGMEPASSCSSSLPNQEHQSVRSANDRTRLQDGCNVNGRTLHTRG